MNRVNIINKKTQVRVIVKVLGLFAAVVSLILAIILDVEISSNNILDLTLYAVSFLIIITILGLNTLSEMVKERECSECAIKLDTHKDDILSLKEKYRELDRKYNKILKEIQKE